MIRAAGRVSGCFEGLRGQLGTRSRVYLSVGGEFVNCTGSEVGVLFCHHGVVLLELQLLLVSWSC